MDLVLASRNPHKTKEFRELLGTEFGLMDLTSFPEIAMPLETGGTFNENAILKATSVSKDVTAAAQLPRGSHLLVIADDSGLEVDALGGAPGTYSARYADENASDADNVNKLLSELRARNVQGNDRSARFRCVIALAQNGKLLGAFEGKVGGEILDLPRGTNGFGYDPVFQPNGFEQTFAEMKLELKNKISHRAKAVAALREALRQVEN